MDGVCSAGESPRARTEIAECGTPSLWPGLASAGSNSSGETPSGISAAVSKELYYTLLYPINPEDGT